VKTNGKTNTTDCSTLGSSINDLIQFWGQNEPCPHSPFVTFCHKSWNPLTQWPYKLTTSHKAMIRPIAHSSNWRKTIWHNCKSIFHQNGFHSTAVHLISIYAKSSQAYVLVCSLSNHMNCWNDHCLTAHRSTSSVTLRDLQHLSLPYPLYVTYLVCSDPPPRVCQLWTTTPSPQLCSAIMDTAEHFN